MADPLGDSLVDSMASPSGNVTGFSTLELSIAGKWLQLLKEIAPNVERATFMFNPATAPYKGGSDFLQVTEAAALSVGVKVSAAPVHEVTDIERVIAAVANEGNGGLISAPDIFVIVHRDVTIELTARYLSISIFRDRWRTDYARGPCPCAELRGLPLNVAVGLVMVRRADFEHDVNVNLLPPYGLDPG
jgi:putative tryptophan/tyrosine transport system substrate-binding protein